jgi:hypothetical protein
MNIDDLMPSTAAIKYMAERGLPRTLNTLAAWAQYGKGPAFHKLGRERLYLKKDLDTFIDSVTAKSEVAA